jgi:pimeloyl-ACP methyl ester carboxylesterase
MGNAGLVHTERAQELCQHLSRVDVRVRVVTVQIRIQLPVGKQMPHPVCPVQRERDLSVAAGERCRWRQQLPWEMGRRRFCNILCISSCWTDPRVDHRAWVRSEVVTGTGSSAIQPRFRTIDGLLIRYAESGPGKTDALLLCPWPESVFAFDQVWGRLAQNTHLVAVDLPGFGHSDRRDDLLAPSAMGEFIVRVADEFGLEHPHAVGPDIGTGALLFAAASHPGRLKSLVVGSGGSAVPIQLGTVLRDWVFDPDLEPYRKMDPRMIVGAALDTIQGYRLPDVVREDYLSAYEGDRFVESMRYARSYHTDLPVLGERLSGIETPVQIIAGRNDEAVPPVNAEYLHERLPHSKLDFLEAGHFVWEEDAEGYGALIEDWWGGRYTEV